jgi:hypothetical protein
MAYKTLAAMMSGRYSGDELPNEVDALQFKAIVELAKRLDRSSSIAKKDYEDFMNTIGLVSEVSQQDDPEVTDDKFGGATTASEQAKYIYDKVKTSNQGIIKLLEKLLQENTNKQTTKKLIEKLTSERATKHDISAIWKSCENKFAHRKVEQNFVILKDDVDSIKNNITNIQNILFSDKLSTKSDITKSVSSLSDKFMSKQEAQDIFYRIDKFANKSEILELISSVKKSIPEKNCVNDVIKDLNTLSRKLEDTKIYSKIITIPTAEMLALNTTPIDITIALNSNYWIEIIGMQFWYDFESAAYTIADPSDKLSVQYETQGEIFQVDSVGFLDQTADKRRLVYHVDWNGVLPAGEKVILTSLNNDYTDGDSPLKVKIFYRQHELIS